MGTFYAVRSSHKKSVIKPAILNPTSEEIPKHYESFLNIRPKFVPTEKNLQFMDKITSTESCTLNMEYNHKENESETIRQNVSNILQKILNLKIRSNLTKDERRVLEELQKNELRV